MKLSIIVLLTFLSLSTMMAQSDRRANQIHDSLYIREVEEKREPVKVLHAEPLYIDLIRDLGARKGEREWNIGLGLTDTNSFDNYTALIEYEWAPVDRLGLELEMPFTFYYPNGENKQTPGSKLNSFKMAAQYSFYVSEKNSTSMALGYIHEIEFTEFKRYGKESFFTGNVYNPFYVAAKRWGNNFHTLLYTGPVWMHHFDTGALHTSWQINSNLHYMIPGTRNFIGLEFNKTLESGDFDMTIRPQMRVGINENLMIGIVTGIPISRENERFSSFVRLIYEPGHGRKGH